jgi:hypothetical protein
MKGGGHSRNFSYGEHLDLSMADEPSGENRDVLCIPILQEHFGSKKHYRTNGSLRTRVPVTLKYGYIEHNPS